MTHAEITLKRELKKLQSHLKHHALAYEKALRDSLFHKKEVEELNKKIKSILLKLEGEE